MLLCFVIFVAFLSRFHLNCLKIYIYILWECSIFWWTSVCYARFSLTFFRFFCFIFFSFNFCCCEVNWSLRMAECIVNSIIFMHSVFLFITIEQQQQWREWERMEKKGKYARSKFYGIPFRNKCFCINRLYFMHSKINFCRRFFFSRNFFVPCNFKSTLAEI